jgi:hypothetical protein
MKKLLLIIIFISFQSLSKADDIRDFQIEGMSIGDSLLEYFSKKKISKFINYDDLPSDMKFRIAEVYSRQEIDMKQYDGMQFYYKPKDPKYIIYALGGFLNCKNRSDCNKIFNEVSGDLKKMYKGGKKKTIIHPDDKSGKSIHTYYDFNLNEGFISVTNKSWSDAVEYQSNISVMIMVNEVREWIISDWGNN